jgi:hypothetical protein
MRPNRPHISSYINFSKSENTKQSKHPKFGRICHPASSYSLASPPHHRFRFAFPLHCRFGEALSRLDRSDPQEKKSLGLTFFCHAQRLQGFFTVCAEVLGSFVTTLGRDSAKHAESPPEIHPNLPPRWLTLPPAIVSATAVLPISSAGIASMSPSISTRSAASPGTSRPHSPSICAAQAPPAV